MKNTLMAKATPEELVQGLLWCQKVGISDGLIAKMCLTSRGQIRRWRDGDVTPRNFDQVLLVVRALVGYSADSKTEMGADALPDLADG